jgi:hypothetical protein
MRLIRVRFTVRRLMIAVAVVALNFGLIRGAETLNENRSDVFLVLPAYALVPSLSLLIVAAVYAVQGLVKRRQAPPFATGYLLLGGVVTFAVCLDFATQMFAAFSTIVREPDPILEESPLYDRLSDLVTIAEFALPQVASALIGGWLAARYGLRIVLSARDMPSKFS